ncbi:hypothetical protein NMY22_g8412 [Coprinellus aureogranulatus]|nr:hypothetical protein NMY22_g8412 [Coprinellus aureogranulatus]
MDLSKVDVEALKLSVWTWRMQEYILIPFYAFYVYYVLTTFDEEVAIIHHQRWNRGKLLFFSIRYGTVGYIALHLLRDHRTYLLIDPPGCKALLVIQNSAPYVSHLSTKNADAEVLPSHGIREEVAVRCGYRSLSRRTSSGPGFLRLLHCIFVYAKPLSELDKELGYTCYGPSPRRWPTAIGLDIRRYASFAATTVLLVLAVICVVVRYKGHSGRLVNIIRRDGGLYYLAVAGVRFTQSIMDTPTITRARPLSNEGLMVLDGMSNIIVPILAQRLMINLRKADYIGSQPMASKLLFAASTPDSDDDFGDEISRPCEDNIELSGSQYRTQAVVASAVQKA